MVSSVNVTKSAVCYSHHFILEITLHHLLAWFLKWNNGWFHCSLLKKRAYFKGAWKNFNQSWSLITKLKSSGTAPQRCLCRKVLWKYGASVQENTYAEVWNYTSTWVFSCKTCYIFSGHLFIRTPMECSFWILNKIFRDFFRF